MENRRDFIKKSALAGLGMSFSAGSYARILGSNDRVRVGIVGFSDRFRQSLAPAFAEHAKTQNFAFVAVSDIWNRRREEADAYLKGKGLNDSNFFKARNNDELFERKDVDAVIISTADFQHALHCAAAVESGHDVYCEKPFAESLEDARKALKAVESSKKIVQIGSQRRSAPNYHSANEFIRSGKFGDITMVEMTWNVNQPGRWRRAKLVSEIRKEDTDWDRYQLNRPKVAWDPRKYLEFRLFYPYSSGIPGQWMSHQIDTVHWFSGLDHPRSVVANGGIYSWKDGRTNADTFTAVFDYGPDNDKAKGFQVLYSSRMNNEAGGVKEYYYSNGGMINLDTNKISPEGGLEEKYAKDMGMKANLLPSMSLGEAAKVETSANTGGDPMTSLHMLNWMECVRSRKEPNAPARVGFNHSVANIMATMALHTGKRVTWDSTKQDVVVS
ncbi:MULTISPECIES: Gfo/Idh/MocA family oxidoreductase [unclassified Spirosoma]|uniref:Gfo/Idh/MocA family protein n=1 Tax=unclassified Spirosoma TaxID=2621999 RepID=UPI000968EC73|nr:MULTISPECIES: Gfo/Idh/MocA family oxidoreductase [unclassified Spirosoma]MBN8823900.1 Gfo/Idh/MocA family oxidoreductase [Spirosoma sp.]OJW79708.1 MAG: oxidoreductase [Spirosoma sp. 48-14]